MPFQVDLLKFLKIDKTAAVLLDAIYGAVTHDQVLTRDLGGSATTKQMTDAVIRHIKTSINYDERRRPVKRSLQNLKFETLPTPAGGIFGD